MKALFIHSADISMGMENPSRVTIYLGQSSYRDIRWIFDNNSRMCTVYDDDGKVVLQVCNVFMIRLDENYEPPQPEQVAAEKEPNND